MANVPVVPAKASMNDLLPDSTEIRRILAHHGVAPRDIEDVLQALRIRIWRKQGWVEAARDRLAYVIGMAKDVAREYRRSAHHRRAVLIDAEDVGLPSGHPDPEQVASARERLEAVVGWVDEIDEKLRDAFVAHVFFGESIADIARAHGVSERTIENRVARGQRDFDAALSRWRARERRRGSERLYGFVGLLGVADAVRAAFGGLRAWLRRLRPLALPVTACLLPGTLGLPDSAGVRAASMAQTPPALSEPSIARPVGATREGLEAPAMRDRPVVPDEAHRSSARWTKAPHPGAARADALARADVDRETTLLQGARAALKTGTAVGRVRARQLLELHRMTFPEGRLAPEREALLLQLL